MTDKPSQQFPVKRTILAVIVAIVLLLIAPRIVYAFLAIVVFVPFYIFANLAAAAWIRRRARGWIRSSTAFALRQIRPLTAARIRVTCLGQIAAFVLLVDGLHTSLEIVQLALLLLGYVFVVAALTLSLIAQMPAFKRLWSDAFTRVMVLTTPFILGYMMKGYSKEWLDETLTFSADNAPMAHFAGTVMVSGLAVATAFMFIALAFELAVMVAPIWRAGGHRDRRKKAPHATLRTQPNVQLKLEFEPEVKAKSKITLRSMLTVFLSANLDESTPEAREWRSMKRGTSLLLVLGSSLLACISCVHVVAMPFQSDLGNVLLETITFDFDAAPAGRCVLTKEEHADSAGKYPKLKVVMLATSQEKGILVTRSPHLFDRILWKSPVKGPERKLEVGRPVTCFEQTASTQK